MTWQLTTIILQTFSFCNLAAHWNFFTANCSVWLVDEQLSSNEFYSNTQCPVRLPLLLIFFSGSHWTFLLLQMLIFPFLSLFLSFSLSLLLSFSPFLLLSFSPSLYRRKDGMSSCGQSSQDAEYLLLHCKKLIFFDIRFCKTSLTSMVLSEISPVFWFYFFLSIVFYFFSPCFSFCHFLLSSTAAPTATIVPMAITKV